MSETATATATATATPAKPKPAFSDPLDVHALLTTPPAPLDHVLPGLLAGTVGMLAGPGGSGKTMLELQLAIALATGTPACAGLFTGSMLASKPASVVLIAAEESKAVLAHRLHAIARTLYERREQFGVKLAFEDFLALLQKNLRLFAGTTQSYVLLDADKGRTRVLNDLAKACESARLVLIDPLRQFHDCDENDSAAMNQVVQALRGLAGNVNAAVVFAHHASKAATFSGQGDAAGAARGSSALTDGVRWQLNLSRLSREQAQHAGISEDARGQVLLLDVAKSNYLPPQPTMRLQRLAGGVLAVTESAAIGAYQIRPKVPGVATPRARQLKLAGVHA